MAPINQRFICLAKVYAVKADKWVDKKCHYIAISPVFALTPQRSAT